MVNYDVLVVGGGAAGLTAAYQLKKYGFRVLVIEKKVFPRPKLCAGLITRKNLRLIRRVFRKSARDLKREGVINFSSSSYRIFFRDRLLHERETETFFNFVDRSVYDKYLLTLAKRAGVEVREGVAAADIYPEENKVITREGQVLTSDYIIGADGVHSIAWKHYFNKNQKLRENFKKEMAMTVQARIPRSEITRCPECPEIYYGVVNRGYGWLFPHREVLVAGIVGLNRENNNFCDIFANYLKLLGINISNVKYRGWPLPYGNFLERPVIGTTLLTGDAAGLVEPITGEGIYYAQRSGELAAESINRVANSTGLMIEDEYSRQITDEIIADLKWFRRLRCFLWGKPLFLQRMFIKLGTKFMGRYITEIVQG